MWFVFLPMAPLSSAAAVIPGLAAVTVAMALLSSVLLSHLLCFHVYLSKTQSPVHRFTRSPPGCVSRVCVCVCSVEPAEHLRVHRPPAPPSGPRRRQETSSRSIGGRLQGD